MEAFRFPQKPPVRPRNGNRHMLRKLPLCYFCCSSSPRPYWLRHGSDGFFSSLTSSSSGALLMAAKSIDESDVGIFCHISHLPGFRGILKQRYSDFIVNEVDMDENVAHLTSLDAPAELVQVAVKNEEKPADQFNRSYDSEIESFQALAGESNAESLKNLIDQITSGNVESISPIVLSPSSDKVHRTAIHNFFKENIKFLVTDTVDGPDVSSKCIRVRLSSGGEANGRNSSRKRKERGGKPFDSRGSSNWPENVGKFLRFNLYKENKDTQEALGLIGKMLGVQSRSFGFAGTKDKRAVTAQRVTVFKQPASKLAALNERLIAIKVGDFCYVKDGLVLGQLLGNRFTVTLRGVVAESEDNIRASADSLGKHGFINYFGLQRFGSGSVSTYLVGAALLRGEWKAAVSMILDPREGDIQRDVIAEAREYFKESGDIDGTLRQLPRHLVAERALLQCLKKCPGNYLQALKAIPRTLRMMYVHSYQSYLWNHAASLRVQKYGFGQVVVGDLVYCQGYKPENAVGISSECAVESYDTNDCDNLEETSEADVPMEEGNDLVKLLSAEDIASGSYTVDDVLLPMPGSRVIYPSNDIAQVYDDLAKKDSINLTESVHNVKEFSIKSLTGVYRRVFQKPKDFEWELLRYKDGNLPLAETDWEKIVKSRPPLNSIKEKESTDDDITQVEKEKDVREPESADSLESQMALKLSFTLPSSCYATMAIRELLKTSTSWMVWMMPQIMQHGMFYNLSLVEAIRSC